MENTGNKEASTKNPEPVKAVVDDKKPEPPIKPLDGTDTANKESNKKPELDKAVSMMSLYRFSGGWIMSY